jgi:hypothetical protein
VSYGDDWRNYVPPAGRGDGESALPKGIRRSGGQGDRRAAPEPAAAHGGKPDKRGARIKRTIVYVHADRDEHVDADTAKEIGLVLKNSTEWIRFDSKREAKRYVALRILQRGGSVRNLQRQVKFALQVARPDKLLQTIATWTADFVYERFEGLDQLGTGPTEQVWRRVVEDCKGMRTEIYQRSKKHFEAQYGIQITES